MLGELNGSHLGFWTSEREWSRKGWQAVTAHLGVTFDDAWRGPGRRVKEVIRNSPAHREASRLRPGELVLSVNGEPLDPGRDLARVLTGRLERDLMLEVRGKNGKQRTVALRPISYPAFRSLLYEHWIEKSRARVDELSRGRLGFLHVRGMGWRSFERYEAELYKVGHGKDGLIIDVRDNGGGYTTDHLLTSLTQPVHAITRSRGGGPGYPQGRMVYARWSKPIVVLCNQNSFSNAEIFCHAIRSLKRGTLVGVRTGGGVISTGGTSVMGFAHLRLPTRGWFLLEDGQDMELNGCVPHSVIWPQPGEIPHGIDRQLDKAVELLVDEIAALPQRPPLVPKAGRSRAH
jgi:tricorn protease